MRTHPISVRLGSAAILALSLGGCSASDYSAPIATFADATTAAESALSDLNKTVTGEYTEFLSQQARTNPRLVVKAADNECELGSERCRVAIIDPANPDKPGIFPPDPLLGNMVVVMHDIDVYAQNLAALVADDSAAKAEADVNSALGSVEHLANTVAKADGKPAGTVPNFATPVGAGVNWLVGEYANQVKLAGLRTATRKADPVIQRAADLFKNAAIFGSDPQRAALVKSFRERIDAYQDDQSSETKLNAAVNAAKTYDDLLQSKPGETFQAMGEAHAALTKALNDASLSWPQVFAKIKSFAAKAQELAKIAKGLAALTEGNP
ncbi:hypothetical protein FRZ61_47500 [Hypericibacter adhaerens]|jgi:hypothetical protein|uniref:Lipoprotein n=1 Tax=Hypericibacter adhaerens TaxID=2602016 RepID=A0A5J6N4F7_9PROT|nr:hypothetical protein [Hypericibacter adhaerens]QEX24808.1 hypothetical protein FRZ61_47500 [Hypericibacter adhaerens]